MVYDADTVAKSAADRWINSLNSVYVNVHAQVI